MRIAGTMNCSLVNGDGCRYVIFLQGCPHHCKGCQNPDTWNPKGGQEISINELIWRSPFTQKIIDGVTLSGGDPFMQQEECLEYLKYIPAWWNVWIYTGYLYEEIKDTELAKRADFIVDGKFERDKLVEGWYGGSSNQRLIDVKKGRILMYGE